MAEGNKIDVTGQVFGRLTAVRCVGKVNGVYKWECRCECGRMVIARVAVLRDGSCRSCGCLRVDKLRKMATTHGMTNTTEHRIWRGLFSRCEIPTDKAYKNYGGRGIKVCERWRDFVNFYADMGPRPSSKHSLDRIDGNGDYEPGNCRWATSAEQNSNSRRNRYITYLGRSATLSQWAREFGICRSVLRGRLLMGWDMKKISNTPVTRRKK